MGGIDLAEALRKTVFLILFLSASQYHLYWLANILILYRQTLLDMNRAPPSKKMKESKELKNDIEAFNLWKYEREQRLA